MLITKHIKQLVDACHPKTPEEAEDLQHEIKPVKFGDRHIWINSASAQVLATYQIPEDAGYLIILRTECYVYTPTSTVAGFRNFSPPPEGQLQWIINAGGGNEELTALVPAHILADVDELLIIKAGNSITLQGVLGAPPTADTWLVRTLVYAYHVGPTVADQIGAAEVVVSGSDT